MTSKQAAEAVLKFHRRLSSPTLNRKAARRAAYRGKAVVQRVTPVDEGHAQKSWRVRKHAKGAQLINDSPYIGILEKGARPHWPPWEPIVRWVARQLGVGGLSRYDLSKYGQIKTRGGAASRSDRIQWVRAVAYKLAAKIATKGSEPKNFVRAVLKHLGKIYVEEMIKVMRAEGNRLKR